MSYLPGSQSSNPSIMRRSPNSPNLSRLLITCSYCRLHGHNIKNCNDFSLILFDELCCIKKNETEDPGQFVNWLATFALENVARNYLVKAYGISKCGCRFRDNMHIIIENITKKTFSVTENDFTLPITDVSSTTFNLLMYALSDLSSDLLTNYAQVYPEESIAIELIYDNSFNKNMNENMDCPICYEEKETSGILKLNCDHELCKECIKQICTVGPSCPFCRSKIENITYNTEGTHEYFVKD